MYQQTKSSNNSGVCVVRESALCAIGSRERGATQHKEDIYRMLCEFISCPARLLLLTVFCVDVTYVAHNNDTCGSAIDKSLPPSIVRLTFLFFDDAILLDSFLLFPLLLIILLFRCYPLPEFVWSGSPRPSHGPMLKMGFCVHLKKVLEGKSGQAGAHVQNVTDSRFLQYRF